MREKKSAAIVLIALGLFLLFKVPLLFITRAASPPLQAEFAQRATTLDAVGVTSMIAGGVALVLGAMVGWRAWARPN